MENKPWIQDGWKRTATLGSETQSGDKDIKNIINMYNYFISKGYHGPLYYSAVKAWLEAKGFSFKEKRDYGESPCRYIYINDILSGEVWVNHYQELDNATLEYIGDNDLMQYCDANM